LIKIRKNLTLKKNSLKYLIKLLKEGKNRRIIKVKKLKFRGIFK